LDAQANVYTPDERERRSAQLLEDLRRVAGGLDEAVKREIAELKATADEPSRPREALSFLEPSDMQRAEQLSSFVREDLLEGSIMDAAKRSEAALKSGDRVEMALCLRYGQRRLLQDTELRYATAPRDQDGLRTSFSPARTQHEATAARALRTILSELERKLDRDGETRVRRAQQARTLLSEVYEMRGKAWSMLADRDGSRELTRRAYVEEF
jgi:hypothetical protein